jgi:hypothetical protein
MRSSSFGAATLLLCAAVTLASPCFSQSSEPLPRFGAGVKISTLGIGVEAATAVTRQSNVRGGFNFLNYDRVFTKDGIDYGGQHRLKSLEAHYDWFLGHGFHLSPGLLIYNGNHLDGTATVPGGRAFTMGSRSYISNPANPVMGTAEIDFSNSRVAPMATIGVGNLLRRKGRRLSIGFEAGAVFEGSPKAMLNFTGSACATFTICQDIASNPQFQDDVRLEANKIDNGTAPYTVAQRILKYYPVISVGVGYRFK